MKLSIICCLSKDTNANQITFEALRNMASNDMKRENKAQISEEILDRNFVNGDGKKYVADAIATLSNENVERKNVKVDIPYEVELLLCTANADKEQVSAEMQALVGIGNTAYTIQKYTAPWSTYQDCYNKVASQVTGDYVTVLNAGDKVGDGLVINFVKAYCQREKIAAYMISKKTPDDKAGSFRQFKVITDPKANRTFYYIDLSSKYDCFPYAFGGTILRTDVLKNNKFNTDLGLESERDFFLRLMAQEMCLGYTPMTCYYSEEYEEHDGVFFKGQYMREWYYDSITDFWIPFFKEMTDKYGKVPVFVQYNFMYSVLARFEGNMDNKNKHVIEEGEGEEYLELIGSALKYIDEQIMLNKDKNKYCIAGDTMKWIYGIMRNGKDFKFHKYYLSGKIYYGENDTLFNSVANLYTNILFINYVDGKLEIDGTVHPILYSMADDIYFIYNKKKYSIVYNERYSLTKAFGTSLCKRKSFHLTIPVENRSLSELFCEATFGDQVETILLRFPSHFSRVCGAFKNSHWFFGKDNEYMMTVERKGIMIRRVTGFQRFKKEIKLLQDMFKTKKIWVIKHAIFRMLYFICRPFMTRKPIWMYIDKIYKGGDSSEYLYKYSTSMKDDINHYYLVDKKSTDYKRLKSEGYKPIVRDSLKHRLLFLYADMMVISNSTVYAFNGYDLKRSSYIRDLPHFHVCCVQHGMSVQKIAIAQNRLRDNTRLYFCASKYEIENLSRPIYGYEGYDALKLTGVPRYDGLKDRSDKQIMISPTWRMQAAMPVKTSESEQRDYNPLFKESPYYKVFNSLINDPRLIGAAKEYGYRIKYVLHPIVSSQVDDFDKNEYVDIVPAVGDMSYEDMFCESSLMVTDFSGIQFDFAYMRKPLVYLHHKDIPQHYEEGSYHYDTMAFGEICHDNDELIDTLIDYMKNGCKMKDEYVKRADDFFYYRDHNNCERIYNEMIKYQKKYIYPEG